MTEFLRISGIYWGLTAMDLMGQLHRMNKDEVLEFVQSCRHPSGGFSPAPNHDPHLLYTLSAVQVRIYIDMYTTLTYVVKNLVNYNKKMLIFY